MGQERFYIKITFMDGHAISFRATPEDGAEIRREDEVEKLLKNNMPAFEVEGTVQLYPVHNIRTIEIKPVHENMPTIRNLELIIAE